MPVKQSWPTTVFRYAAQGYEPIERTSARCIHCGIFWHTEERLVAFVQPITEIALSSPLIDSDQSHDAAWDTARHVLTCPSATEYFVIPRGRILWDRSRLRGIIYHGNATPRTVFPRLASLFWLTRWEARLDVHYLTGDALEAFHDLD